MAAGADADVPTDEPVHTSDKVENLRLRLAETDETVKDAGDAAG